MKKQINKTEIKSGKSFLKTTASAATAFMLVITFITMMPDASEARQFKKMQRSPDDVVCMLGGRLDLTEEQKTAILPIIEESIEKRKALKDDFRSKQQERHDALRSEMEVVDDEIKTQLDEILTDDQMAKYTEFKEERKQRMQERQERRSEFGGKRHFRNW